MLENKRFSIPLLMIFAPLLLVAPILALIGYLIYEIIVIRGIILFSSENLPAAILLAIILILVLSISLPALIDGYESYIITDKGIIVKKLFGTDIIYFSDIKRVSLVTYDEKYKYGDVLIERKDNVIHILFVSKAKDFLEALKSTIPNLLTQEFRNKI